MQYDQNLSLEHEIKPQNDCFEIENLDPFQISQKQLYEACKLNGYDNEIYNTLSSPERFVEIKITMKMDDGTLKTFQ